MAAAPSPTEDWGWGSEDTSVDEYYRRPEPLVFEEINDRGDVPLNEFMIRNSVIYVDIAAPCLYKSFAHKLKLTWQEVKDAQINLLEQNKDRELPEKLKEEFRVADIPSYILKLRDPKYVGEDTDAYILSLIFNLYLSVTVLESRQGPVLRAYIIDNDSIDNFFKMRRRSSSAKHIDLIYIPGHYDVWDDDVVARVADFVWRECAQSKSACITNAKRKFPEVDIVTYEEAHLFNLLHEFVFPREDFGT